MAIEIAKESSDMFLPRKAVVGALAVLIRNYDVEYIQAPRSIGYSPFLAAYHCQWGTDQGYRGKVQSLAEVLASPANDQDSEERTRREALRKFVLLRQGTLMYY